MSVARHEPRHGRGVLLYGMYEMGALDSAPRVRIAMMRAALERHARLEFLGGGRTARAMAAARWLLGRGWRRIDGVYVESSTSTATPADLALLALLRLLGRPVGVYFRDAYQLFRRTYPIVRRRQLLMDQLWRLSMPILRGIATHRFVPSVGLARVLGIRDPILLPSGTDPVSPDLGAGPDLLVGYVGSTGWADGFDRLLEAMQVVRDAVPSARLLVICPPAQAARLAPLPDWVELRQAGRDEVPELLRPARLCVIPRPITEYTDLAVPVKLWDYMSLGKPIVATATAETRAVLLASGAGLVTGDLPTEIAEGLLTLLRDADQATDLGARGRRFALLDTSTWDARAQTVLAALAS
jgi:glycosyltransferase involved in cell wall biosynthesis